jgi:hypothetical protein
MRRGENKQMETEVLKFGGGGLEVVEAGALQGE